MEARKRLYRELKGKTYFDGLIGSSPPMLEIIERIEQVGPTQATVLIEGESGAGKELVARAVHKASDRANKPLVVVNCAALPEDLLEAELFGTEPGAFTGATGSVSRNGSTARGMRARAAPASTFTVADVDRVELEPATNRKRFTADDGPAVESIDAVEFAAGVQHRLAAGSDTTLGAP